MRVEKRSGEEILDMFTELAPYINGITAEDMGISVVKNGIYTVYVPAETLDLGTKAGTPVQGQVSAKCLSTGQRVVQTVSRDKSIYGIPYVACALPIKTGDKVVGCIITTQTVATQEKITSVASELAASAEEFTAGMEELSAGASELSATSRDLENLGKGLSAAIRQTDEIVDFIKNVANQTNLLGLNAAIEAARVGEMGRGFGVVAEEVRKLAVASSESVKNITESLKQIQQSINDLSQKIAMIDKTVEQQAVSVQEMAQGSQSLASMATELSAVADTMFASTDK